jgi:hypothetical protein
MQEQQEARVVCVPHVACAVAGFAKLDYHPGHTFLELIVDACVTTKLQGFDPQELSNVISGKYRSIGLV